MFLFGIKPQSQRATGKGNAAFADVKHSQVEERQIIVGQVISIGIILVVFTKRGNTIRIISAKRASRDERKFYEQRKTQP